MAHFLGQDQNQNTPSSTAYETSLTVKQFFRLVNVKGKPQAPSNPFRVETVTVEERYCQGCFGVRRHDAIQGRTWNVQAACTVFICRRCGKQITRGG
jgi:hypothetical protein